MKKQHVFFLGCFSHSEYAGMFSVFYYQFNNRIPNIIRNRIVGDILGDIKATCNVWKKDIQNLSCVFIIWDSSIFFY